METPRQNNASDNGGAAAATGWDSFFKWVGIVVVGLFVLGVISGF